MPTSALFKPRLTSAYPSSGATNAYPGRRPRIIAPDSAPATTCFPAKAALLRPAPANAVPQGKFVSSTHYVRYVLWQGRQNSELVISSHGSRVISSAPRNVLPVGTALHFYGPDGAPINTTLVDQAFVHDKVAARPYEIRSGGQTYLDYELSKIQVRAGAGKGETYGNIIECLPGYDLVTIEQLDDEGPRDHLLLSELLAHLRSQGHRYTKIHCFFCRSIRARDLKRHPSLEQLVKQAYVVR